MKTLSKTERATRLTTTRRPIVYAASARASAVGAGARERQAADAVGERRRIAGATSCSADVDPAANANKAKRSIAGNRRAATATARRQATAGRSASNRFASRPRGRSRLYVHNTFSNIQRPSPRQGSALRMWAKME
eukprot:scaffold792_cov122-Isochrysis_galbana.AAC.2